MSQRILYIIDSLKIGGAEMLLLGLLDAVHARGDVAHVAYFTPGPLEKRIAERGVAMTRLSHRGLRDPMALFRTLSLMRRLRPDIVHTHLVKSDLIGQMAARLTGIRRLITLHNTDPWRRNRFMSALYRIAVGKADACIAVSDRVADHVGKYSGYRRDRIMTIVNGIDLVQFDPLCQPMDLTQFGVPADAPVVAVIGSLTLQKDHDNFIKAAVALADLKPEPYFLIVGGGTLRDRIAAAIDAAGPLRDRIILTGEISQMPQLLAAVDVLAISSRWEGLPMVLLEGMAMSRAVVATAVGGIPDVVENGVNGALVPAVNPAALAAAIAGFLNDDEARVRLGRAARKTVAKSFDSDAMRRRIFELYDTILEPDRAHRRAVDVRVPSPQAKELPNGR